MLVEARERGQSVPRDLIDQGNAYLRFLATRDGNTLEEERNGAYALYLLTRQGETLGAEASRLRERLESRYADTWRGDIATAYLASAMKLMKQDREADNLFGKVELAGKRPVDRWHDDMTADAELLYLAALHFPGRLEKLPAAYVDRLAQRISQHQYHSLSASTTLLALDAYANVASARTAGKLALSEILVENRVEPIALPAGLFPKAAFSAAATGLRFGNDAGLPAFSFVSQAGFERMPPSAPLREGFEILREYTDREGKAVTSVKQGEEITVRLKFRSITQASSWNVALVDLLPGGFEMVVPPSQAQTTVAQASDDDASASAGDAGDGDGGGGDGDGDGGDSTWGCPICQAGTTANLSFADFREDRSVFYAGVTPALSEIVYRIKATNSGTFTVPPAYGEGMYDRGFNARSAAGSITVTAP